MNATIIRLLQLALITVLISACTGSVKTNSNVDGQNRVTAPVWPSPPANPRIKLEQVFSTPDELGIGRSFWQWLGDVVFGADETHMVRPMDITTVGSHLIYVADPGVRGVHRFDVEDQSYHLIQGKNKQELPSPVALASDTKGNVFISDSKLAQLLVIRKGSEYATPLKLSAPLKQPTGMAIERNSGDIYLLDTQQHQLLIFSASGELKKRIGQRGLEAGEFNFPTHIEIENNTVLITDSLNFRVQLFDLNGKYLSDFGKAGQSSGYLSRPKGVAMDKLGHIYVVDGLLNNIQLFNQQGKFLMTAGEQGQKPGQFWLPVGIHISPQQKIYVADAYNRRVQVFSYIGKEL
ncbi:NHL repeat domain protein [hydrothermal vent metagenome]|uniref:NHL repeat domain protein n=1 Tax=hydrothermal vent metagenome TaxID=652676 RepID=A0A3B0X6V9_9ZZZZ